MKPRTSAMKYVRDGTEVCFACGRKIGKREKMYDADTRDDQRVFVGASCMKKIKAGGVGGYQPERGGPRLWALEYHFDAKLSSYLSGYAENNPKSEMPSRGECARWGYAEGLLEAKKKTSEE